MDPLPQLRRRKKSQHETLLNGQMHPGVKQQPPTADQRLAGGHRFQLLRRRLRQENDFIGQAFLGRNAQFFVIDDLQQRLAVDDVTLAMRNAIGEARQIADPA